MHIVLNIGINKCLRKYKDMKQLCTKPDHESSYFVLSIPMVPNLYSKVREALRPCGAVLGRWQLGGVDMSGFVPLQ